MTYLAAVVGIPGAGKSSTIDIVDTLLGDHNLTTAKFHDRHTGDIGPRINELIRRRDVTPEARLFLFIAARRQIIDTFIKPALSNHDVVLVDRYYPCSIATQAYGEGLDLDLVTLLSLSGVSGAMPNRIFVLDIPPTIMKQRLQRRRNRDWLYDDMHNEFHEKVRQGYLAQAMQNPIFTVIDASLPQAHVANSITSAILRDLKLGAA